MIKLWISDKLELRHAINGWPVEPLPGIPSEMNFYHQQLAKAKKESVCIPRVEFVNAITDRIDIKTGEAIEYIESNYNPDTFVDLPISITIDRDQVKCCRLDCLASMQGGKCKAEIIVKVARLKPVEKPEPDSIFTREDVREMLDAANIGLKDRILAAFKPAWNSRQVLRMNATEVLAQVLDELNIK